MFLIFFSSLPPPPTPPKWKRKTTFKNFCCPHWSFKKNYFYIYMDFFKAVCRFRILSIVLGDFFFNRMVIKTMTILMTMSLVHPIWREELRNTLEWKSRHVFLSLNKLTSFFIIIIFIWLDIMRALNGFIGPPLLCTFYEILVDRWGGWTSIAFE